MSSILVGQGTSLVDALGVIKRANISSIDGSGDRILGAAAGKAAAAGGGRGRGRAA